MHRNSMMAGTAAVLLVVCLLGGWIGEQGVAAGEQKEYTEIFRSQAFQLGPGDVIDEYFTRMKMPPGHIALRSFDAQVVLEDGTPVPLSETYLHHWLVLKFFVKQGFLVGDDLEDSPSLKESPNAGTCERTLTQWFGLGSETRHTNTEIPAPYGLPTGDLAQVPEGYEEMWVLNVHAIDTRGAVNQRACTECTCEYYNITGRDLPEGYQGGLGCCRDKDQCAVKPDFQGPKRSLYMEYTVKWVPMDEEVVPVRIYIFDVTDSKSAVHDKPHCRVEYDVPQCSEGFNNSCIHTAESSAFLPEGGDVVYAVAHQHTGGVGSILYNENGDEICSSKPLYGRSTEAGNESGYIVGMTTCYPEPGNVSIKAGEKLRMISWYGNEERHTGVMGLFYLLVADNAVSSALRARHNVIHPHLNKVLGVTIIVAAIMAVQLGISAYLLVQKRRTGRSDYEAVPPDYHL